MPKWVTQNKILLSILAVIVTAVIAMYVLDGDNINTFPGDKNPTQSPSTSATPKPDPTKKPPKTNGPTAAPGTDTPDPSNNPTRDPGSSGPTKNPQGSEQPNPNNNPDPTQKPPRPQQVVNEICALARSGVGLLNIALLRGLRLEEVQRIIRQECPQLLSLNLLAFLFQR